MGGFWIQFALVYLANSDRFRSSTNASDMKESCARPAKPRRGKEFQ